MNKTGNASQWRVELAHEVAAYYRQQAGVQMMVLGGSPSRNLADRFSDLDIVVYWDTIDHDWITGTPPLSGTRAERKFVRSMPEHDTVIESYYLDTLKVDLGHTTLGSWEKMCKAVLESFDPTPYKQKSISGFLESIPLHGEELVLSWKEQMAVYPEELAISTINNSKGFLVHGCLAHQGIDREELLFYQDAICSTLKKLVTIVAASNRVYFSAEEPRWIEHELNGMSIKPDNMWSRVLAILTAEPDEALAMLDELAEEVFCLAETSVPGVDFSKTRKGRKDLAVIGCDTKPALHS